MTFLLQNALGAAEDWSAARLGGEGVFLTCKKMGGKCIDRQEKIIIMLQTKMNGLTYNDFSKGLGEVRFLLCSGGFLVVQ